MGKAMSTPDSLPFSQLLSLRQFDQLRKLLHQVAQEKDSLLLTEKALPVSLHRQSQEQPHGRSDFQCFTLVASTPFSVLLLGELLLSEQNPEPFSASQSITDREQAVYQVQLTFEPEAIDTFLANLVTQCLKSQDPEAQPFLQKLDQARSALGENNAQFQSEFTLRLVGALADMSSVSVAVSTVESRLAQSEATLHHQLEQERLLNQVATHIRQSLELPVILQTAVQQVRQFLQSDRLVIYRFDHQDVALPEYFFPLLEDTLQSDDESGRCGSVIYEARASDAIPSVLNFSEAHCFVNTSNLEDLLEKNLAIAVEDVAVKYAQAPCLLRFLQQAKVQAKLVAPIFIRNQLWGLLIAHQCFEPRQWQEHEQRFLQQIAEHLAIAISQAQLYAELQQQKRTLEQRVAERTQELHDVMQAAQAANRAKSEFLASVSHELRTPLTCIIGMSSTLQRWTNEALNERQRNFLQTIHDSGEYLLTLINDILDLSQVEAGKMLLDISEFSLSRLSRQTLKAFEGQASLNEVNLEFDLHVAPQRDRFVADPRRLQQILFNLLDNAIKFTPSGRKVILRVFSEDNLAVFQVKDQGIGIPDDQLPLLFQKFHQLNAGYHRQYRGTGLGLALTKQLIELHGGWIDVESTVGVGSVFTVRLPMQQIRNDGSPLKTRTVTASNPVKGRIVLIEQSEENANLICDVLTAAGYQIVWMLEGSAAVDQIEVLQPIAVIANAQLPDIDGHHLIRCLRNNPATKNLKVITLISSLAQATQGDQRSISADDYLTYPIRPDLLLQKIMVLTNR